MFIFYFNFYSSFGTAVVTHNLQLPFTQDSGIRLWLKGKALKQRLHTAKLPSKYVNKTIKITLNHIKIDKVYE